MTLKEYLEKFSIKPQTFAYRCGVSITAIYYIIHSYRKPRLSTAIKVEKESGGRVTLKEMMEIEIKPKVKDGRTERKSKFDFKTGS